jgi:thiazole synthase
VAADVPNVPTGADALPAADAWTLAGRTWSSRLIVGTGKYRDAAQTQEALAESGAEIVTVALRRVDLKAANNLLSWIDRERYTLLPNTAGCYTADEAVRVCRLARELGIADLVKLEVIGDPKTLLPDNEQTLAAARTLLDEGFTVLPYRSDDPIVCRKLQEMGCAAVMPLAAPIGSGLGIQNPHKIRLIVEQATVPVIVDAGVGTASDATVAMELGCDAVLMNTAIAEARDPVQMARAMRLGVLAGRLALTAGRMPRRSYASASSPAVGLLE